MIRILPKTNYTSCSNIDQYTVFDNVVMVFAMLAKKDAIHAFMYSLKLCFKGFFKAR